MDKIELLSPAGNLEKLKIAVLYGADAVYIGGNLFGLRANADNFTFSEMEEGAKFAHDKGRKVYLAVNILPHNHDIELLPDYIEKAAKTGIDAMIVSDAGTIGMIKEIAPHMEIHLSTQASCTNWRSAKFWHDLGVKRIVLARELTLEEITEVHSKCPDTMEIESFIHGAMCIAYSGRCLLSSYLIDRDGNKGECGHPCRWNYSLVEEKRPDMQFPVEEDKNGTYIMNSKDLCMIQYIPELIKSGIKSFKIEGRAKSAYYTAIVTAAYRRAIDAYYHDPNGYVFDEDWLKELRKASHREFYTGFYFGNPLSMGQIYTDNTYISECVFCGLVKSYDADTKMAVIEQRNRLFTGEKIEVLRPDGTWYSQTIRAMKNKDGENIEVAPHPQMIIGIELEQPVPEMSIIRKQGRQ